MIDESESGEAYDKIANQRPRPAPKHTVRRRRRHELSLTLEAKLVRSAMSETRTVSELAKELALKPQIVSYHLKRLGLEGVVSKQRSVRAHRTYRLRRLREIQS